MATKTVLETRTAREATGSFDGIAFNCMSDEFLIQSFDVLCERTADTRPNPEDWLNEWDACRHEILARLRAGFEAAHDQH